MTGFQGSDRRRISHPEDGVLGGAAPSVQPSGASQAAVTLDNTDNDIGGLSIGATYSQAKAQALRDKCEELADDVRALSALVHALRTALVAASARGDHVHPS